MGVDGSGAGETTTARAPGWHETAPLRPSDRGDPVRIGRYTLGERLGAGGMGVVCAAWDPELSRRVAIKLLHVGGHHGGEARSRLLREARALACIRHPNVIEIYDVGVRDCPGAEIDVWLVMELVDGIDGVGWLRAARREWQAVLDVFIAAARGLEAAHAAGMLHRDFKPANFLVGSDGRVRVVDFGLARALADHSGSAASDASVSVLDGSNTKSSESIGGALTTHGVVMGTPRYMAPEQHFGGEPDVRTDVYNFCASLFWAIYGRAPFAGDGIAKMARAKQSGQMIPRPRDAAVPSALYSVLARGLRPEKERRFPCMEELRGELERIRAPRRAGVGWVVGAALVGAVGFGFGVRAAPKDASACAAQSDDVDGVWSDANRARVLTALHPKSGRATDVSSTMNALDVWATTWGEAQRTACGEPSSPGRDARLGCLVDARRGLRATVELLGEADPKVTRRAGRLVAELPDLASCSERTAPTPPLEPGESQRAEDILTGLARARALALSGRLTEAKTLVERAMSSSVELSHVPTRVEALYVRGLVLEEAADHEEATAALEDAYLQALDAGLDDRAADAALRIVRIVGIERPDVDVEPWIGRARAQLARLGPDSGREADLLRHLAGIDVHRGDARAALAKLLEAERISSALSSRDPIEAGLTREKIGQARYGLGDYAAARAELELAVGMLTRAVGEDHPLLVSALSELGHALRKQGHRTEALAHYEKGLRILERTEEPDHPDLALTHGNLAIVLDELGRYEEALPHYERSLEIVEKQRGPEHPWAAVTHQNMGINLGAQGRYPQAERELRRALEIWEIALGPEHPDAARTWRTLGDISSARGRLDDAVSQYERALEIFEKSLDSDHPELVSPLLQLALTLRRRGDAAAARATAERAWSIATSRLGPSHVRTGRALAVRSLLAIDAGHREAARPEARRAAEILADEPGEEAWLGIALLARAYVEEEHDAARALARGAASRLRESGSMGESLVEEANSVPRGT